MINLDFSFRTPEQRDFFYLTCRNQIFSGGFGNGKTYVGCQKVIYLASTFPFYRTAIFRFDASKLKETTAKTFYKVCPPSLYDPKLGGSRTDSLNKCTFVNGSEVLFMHLKDIDEGIVRGLEVNSVLVDQIEEISESMYLMLKARIGRWDKAIVPNFLLSNDWPRDKHGRALVPNYFMGLSNPDSELHWLWKRFHEDSEEYQTKYKKNHKMINGETTAETIDAELLSEMYENDQTWVDRFIKGKWGIPGGSIHTVNDLSVMKFGVDFDHDFVKKLTERGVLTRVLDHGDSSPTCCLWFSAYSGNYYCYREYYKADALISYHRTQVSNLSGSEKYSASIIDPACAMKTMQKYGGRWSVIDEYTDPRLQSTVPGQKCPTISWSPGDNDELSTRNRISEYLALSHTRTSPGGKSPAPRLYFLERSNNFPNGAYHAIRQLRGQKRKKVGTVDGKDIFSDERADVVDHAYDPIRYYCASHSSFPSVSRPKMNPGSFGWLRNQVKMHRININQ